MLHTVATTPGFDIAPDSVYYGWKTDILDPEFEFLEGAVHVPDGPGLGIEVDEAVVGSERTESAPCLLEALESIEHIRGHRPGGPVG